MIQEIAKAELIVTVGFDEYVLAEDLMMLLRSINSASFYSMLSRGLFRWMQAEFEESRSKPGVRWKKREIRFYYDCESFLKRFQLWRAREFWNKLPPKAPAPCIAVSGAYSGSIGLEIIVAPAIVWFFRPFFIELQARTSDNQKRLAELFGDMMNRIFEDVINYVEGSYVYQKLHKKDLNLSITRKERDDD